MADARRARIGVFVFFFLCGLVMGLWAAGLPSLNDRLDLGPARLGTVLLLISGGALVSMLATGPLVDRWSSRAVCWFAGPFSAVVLLGPALAPNYPVLTVLAVVFGLGLGVTEVAMNAHSVEVERRYGRPIISAFHGTWSLGGAAGGAVTALVLQAGMDAQTLLVAAAVVVPFLYLPAARMLLPDPPPHAPETSGGQSRSGGSLKWGLIALLGGAAFAGHLAEGAAIDWAALHARWVLGTDPALAPLAYTVFAVAMTTIRLLGDPIRARLGSVRTIQLAGLLATFGYVLVLAAPLAGSLAVVCAWTGWALAGIGLATVVPVIFSAVGASGGPVGRALALVTAFGYSGLLVGPAVLGYVAEASSLPIALIVPAVMAAIVAVAGAPAIRALARATPAEPAKEPAPAATAD